MHVIITGLNEPRVYAGFKQDHIILKKFKKEEFSWIEILQSNCNTQLTRWRNGRFREYRLPLQVHSPKESSLQRPPFRQLQPLHPT